MIAVTPKKLLITNDDGIESPSIKLLIEQFSDDYEITVVAPKHHQSAKGMSHAHGDSWVTTSEHEQNGVHFISVDNSPTTCVSVALKGYELTPDLLISGINFGENLGLNMFYSGTLGAAWEGAMDGILSIASSLELPSGKHFSIDPLVDFSVAVSVTKEIVEKLMDEKPACKLWSINTPSNATLQTKIKKCTVAPQRWNEPVIREERNDLKNGKRLRFEFDPMNYNQAEETDIYNLQKGFVTLTEINSIKFPWYSM